MEEVGLGIIGCIALGVLISIIIININRDSEATSYETDTSQKPEQSQKQTEQHQKEQHQRQENPAKNFKLRQKYSIVCLMSFLIGADESLLYNKTVQNIFLYRIKSLGVSENEVTRYIKRSMQNKPEDEIDVFISALKEIDNKNYLKGLYEDCNTIAIMSGNPEMISIVSHIFIEVFN